MNLTAYNSGLFLSLAIRTLASAMVKQHGAVRGERSCANDVANEEGQIVRQLSRF